MNSPSPFYSITEAAEALRCSTDELLKCGSDGALSFFIKVPDNVDLYNVLFFDLDLKSDPSMSMFRRVREPIPAPDIYFLLLPPKVCQQLLQAGTSLAHTFKDGFKLDRKGDLQYTKSPWPPIEKHKPPGYGNLHDNFMYFVTYRSGTNLSDWKAITHPRAIEIKIEDLRVSREAILALKEQWIAAHSGKLEQVPLGIHLHRLEDLYKLHKVHTDIWGLAHLEGFQPPSSKEICGLLKIKGLTRNRAECGAYILYHTHLDKDQESGKSVLVAKFLTGLIECANVHWSVFDEHPIQDHSNAKVASWLVKNSEFSPHRAKTAVSLIRPVEAPKGRKLADGV